AGFHAFFAVVVETIAHVADFAIGFHQGVAIAFGDQRSNSRRWSADHLDRLRLLWAEVGWLGAFGFTGQWLFGASRFGALAIAVRLPVWSGLGLVRITRVRITLFGADLWLDGVGDLGRHRGRSFSGVLD